MIEINAFLNQKLIISIIFVLIMIIFFKIMSKIVNLRIKNMNKGSIHFKKRATYIKLISNIIKYIVLILAITFILKLYGVNVTSIVAGLGIVSVIVGLSLQDALKDIIIGVNIILDDYFSVGDVIKINNIEGKVIEIGLKTTKIRDINTQDICSIANRNITDVINTSEQLDIDIPIPYEEKIENIEEIIKQILEKLKENKGIKEVEYKGVNEFASSAIYYKIRIICIQETKPQIKRDALREIKIILDNNNIQIPYNQLDVTIKK